MHRERTLVTSGWLWISDSFAGKQVPSPIAQNAPWNGSVEGPNLRRLRVCCRSRPFDSGPSRSPPDVLFFFPLFQSEVCNWSYMQSVDTHSLDTELIQARWRVAFQLIIGSVESPRLRRIQSRQYLQQEQPVRWNLDSHRKVVTRDRHKPLRVATSVKINCLASGASPTVGDAYNIMFFQDPPFDSLSVRFFGRDAVGLAASASPTQWAPRRAAGSAPSGRGLGWKPQPSGPAPATNH
ncbi:hypothetical protein DFH06DRAFT_1142635 [Mycena polygramma]|nr:hypothetical protein DFH06DRAFT_1142635 [Mycena polygramma]